MPPKIHENLSNTHGNHAEKRAIPKFASFRPKGTPPVQGDGNIISGLSDALPSPPVKISSSSGLNPYKYSSSEHRSSRHNEYRAEKDRIDQVSQRSAGATPEHDEGASKPFVVDREGDPKILAFGALDRFAKPSYFRFGAGNVLGSPSDQRIDRAISNEKGVTLSDNHHDMSKKGDGKTFWKPFQGRIKEPRIKPRASQILRSDAAADFIPLRGAKRRRGSDGSNSHPSSSSDGDGMNYRSIEGKPKFETAPKDGDLIYGSEASSASGSENGRPFSLAASTQRKRSELLKKVDLEPTNCGAWVDLINHQDEFLGLDGESKKSSLTNAERRSNADVKLSMYEKALDKVKCTEDRQILLLGMMEEACHVWESQKLSSEWKIVLRDNPEHLRLWTKYLDFKQTTFASFRYEEVQDVYADCLRLLNSTRKRPGRSIAEEDKVYEIQIYILLRMTMFMRESGFVEHATAVWQALLEYEFFRPASFQDCKHKENGPLLQDTLSKFEQFWDSEVPRIGEDRCQGWASFCWGQGEPPQPKTDVAGNLKDAKNLWASWVVSERRHGLLARNPARAIDDVKENDPYRVVLFSDVRPFLIESPTTESQSICLDAFLTFCHLPPRQQEGPDSRSRIWSRDGYLRNDLLTLPRSILQSWGLYPYGQQALASERRDAQGDETDCDRARHKTFGMLTPDYLLSLDSLFAVPGSWFSVFDAWQSGHSGDHGSLEDAWVLRSLKSLVATDLGGDCLAEYLLALELRLAPETVRKTARGLLKERPSSLPLYNAYAVIEYRLGNAIRGENVITTSINMGKRLHEPAQWDTIVLWRTWIWEILNAGNTREALERMLMYGDEQIRSPLPEFTMLEAQGVKPSLLLRTETALVAYRDHMLSLKSYQHAALAIDCLILFDYLRSSLSLSLTTSTFKTNLVLLSTHAPASSSTHEHLHQSFARLLQYHTTHTHPVKPYDIRSLLAESIACFPQNTMFLSLYAWNEARFRIDDRVRSIVKDVVLTAKQGAKNKDPQSVIPHFFAIHAELNRAITFGSNQSSIRSAFERAAESDAGAHCAGLWKLYFLFEHSRGDLGKARGVLWRGIGACPWAKELYMLAFEYLRGADGFGNQDLRGIYELMGEKEMRIHVGLEDIFEVMDERKALEKVR